jgi:hypothetical protein
MSVEAFVEAIIKDTLNDSEGQPLDMVETAEE